jgi:hypothetical protein
VLRVLARAPIVQQILSQVGQTQRLIQFEVSKQARVGGDLGTVKLQLQTTIKSNPQSLFFACTHWIFRFS